MRPITTPSARRRSRSTRLPANGYGIGFGAVADGFGDEFAGLVDGTRAGPFGGGGGEAGFEGEELADLSRQAVKARTGLLVQTGPS